MDKLWGKDIVCHLPNEEFTDASYLQVFENICFHVTSYKYKFAFHFWKNDLAQIQFQFALLFQKNQYPFIHNFGLAGDLAII